MFGPKASLTRCAYNACVVSVLALTLGSSRLVSTFKPNKYTTFRVTVYSQAPLEQVDGNQLRLFDKSVPAR